MIQLQEAQKGAEVTTEVSERELELEAQLVEARSIIQEQVRIMLFLVILLCSIVFTIKVSEKKMVCGMFLWYIFRNRSI